MRKQCLMFMLLLAASTVVTQGYGSQKGTIQKYFANPKKYFKYFFQNHCRKVRQI